MSGRDDGDADIAVEPELRAKLARLDARQRFGQGDGELSDARASGLLARIAWSRLIEPGDGVAGTLVEALGAGRSLEMLVRGVSSSKLRAEAATAGLELGSEASSALKRWCPRLSREETVRDIERALESELTVILPGDPLWPESLADLGAHQPLLLWVRGDPSWLTTPSLSVVGARAVTGYGTHITAEIVDGVCASGLSIVSGAAYGVDAVAHRTALALEAPTVAVLAGGADRAYPAAHDTLLERVAASGTVCSEMIPGAAPTRWRFLQRNRCECYSLLMVRAVIYTRVSLDRTGEMLAVERQREDCLAIVRQRGWELIEEYSDNSVSASKRSVKRPAYDRMVEDYRAGLFDALVCWDLDRLTRQPRQLEEWIEAAEERGLLLATANGEADLSVDAGRMFARIKAAVARQEIERKGARQERAAAQRAEGGRMSSSKPCLGYTSSNEIVEAEAAVVRSMFERVAAGETVYGVTLWLNESGMKPKQGERWSRTTVRGMLSNPRYVARVVLRGEVLPVPGSWQAIVEPGLFDTVQAILNDPRRKTNHWGTARKHLLSGVAVCGACGSTVRASAGAYACQDRCVSKARLYVDEIVLQVARGRLAQLDLVDLDGESVDPELDAQVVALRRRLTTIEADYDAGLIDGRRFAVATEKV